MNKKTNVKKEQQQVINSNAITDAKDILKNTLQIVQGLLPTNLGTKKATIYKENIFENCTEKEKKSLRKKLRNTLYSLSSAVINEQEKEKKNKLIDLFNEFYKQAYITNDYSLQSVCNENLKSEKKDILQKALEICKK